jgi:pSer/pThr/pTyr-binding forkhead associated (FHA) protein
MSIRASGTTPRSGVRRYGLRHEGGQEELDASISFVVGREDDCQLVLKNTLVSRRHARFYVSPGGLIVEDLGSLNGVFVNQRRIEEPTLLAHGDVVGIGIDSIEVVDVAIAPRREKPTQPQVVQPGESDVDGPEPVTTTARLDILTDREREVFELIVLGYTQREIGTKLHVSVKTIETHRAHIADKLRCRTRAELVAYAITAGLLRHVSPAS